MAFVTDVGQLKDKSFNQGTFDGVKLYAAANGLSYKYYQPANGSEATDDDRYDAMKAAVEGGADVVVCAGYLQEAALKKAAIEHPETPFVFIDGYPLTDDAGNTLSNVAGIAFKEEQAGYLAGYAAVMDGFTKLGFSGGGGGTNPACCRFGYGYVQGANAAALEKGVTVDMNYSWQYGSNFSASTDLQTMINGWYVNGTEIVFACGGSMFQSSVAAASANDGYVIGVDVDQSGESEYVVTSAMKGLADAVQWAVAKVYDGTFDTIGGQQTSLGRRQRRAAAHRRGFLALRDLHRGGVRVPVPADGGRHPGGGRRLHCDGQRRDRYQLEQRECEYHLIHTITSERGRGLCALLFCDRKGTNFLCFPWGII